MTKIFLVALMLMFVSAPPYAWAQQANDGSSTAVTAGPRRQLATIVSSGIIGAILGLSTLSFYGRPQDQLGNIAVGFAMGVIAGTIIVTVQSVSSPSTPTSTSVSTFVAPTVLFSQAQEPGIAGSASNGLAQPVPGGVFHLQF